MILNQTPIRTSKNYKINNIELDLEFPNKIEEFGGLTISGDTSNFNISDEVSKIPLKYGNGLESQIFEKGNQNIKIEETKTGSLYLEFNLNEENSVLAENIEIDANTKSKTTIYIKYMSNDNFECYHNGIIRVNAKANSKTNIVVVNMLNNKSNNLLSIENTLEENARVDYTIVDFGGKTSITNYYSNIKENGAKANINTIYLGAGNQVFDINYIAELFGKNTETNIEVQGALKDEARKNFKGTIDFKKGSKKAKGDENEFCMLLSDKAKSKALPMLLCTEEDVEGNHSSAAGKIEDDKLFYIMSRGLSEKDAMKLIVKAKFNKILETIKDEELKQEIVEEIDKRLD
ncbi:MAG: SufD family Fe-S cluster assembly protein [Clostridia bacterium]|nr:SufD family Fe-S cluster assembly protein [Clostridia bacterium]